jgi:hypothetical protein
MITVITGLTGSGKTFLMSRLALKRRKLGDAIYSNLNFNFPNNNDEVYRWYALSETFNLDNGVICIDEGQKLFDARNWSMLPSTFALKIASHRHDKLDIITTTQAFGHIDIRIRQNVHEIYHCRSMFRFPKNERYKPVFQAIKVIKKRSFDDISGSLKWDKVGERAYFISKYFTKQLYDTYANISFARFICKIKRDKKKWLITLTSRNLAK